MALLIEHNAGIEHKAGIDHKADAVTDVADAAAAVYSARRDRVKTTTLSELVTEMLPGGVAESCAVVVAEQRVVEIVPDDQLALERLAPVVWLLAGRGWDVVVLVPCGRLGEGHTALRSAPATLQPWWVDSTGTCFGAPEIP